jgi:hypothetical protein
MNKTFFVSALLLLMLLVSQVQAQNTWIYGTVTSDPVSVTFGITVYSFSFQVDSSSETLDSDNLTCLWLSQPTIGNSYNFSGVLISDNSSGMPVGAFLVSGVNLGPSDILQNATDWTWTFRQIWTALSTVGSLFATLMVQVVQAATGYSLSPFLASLLVLMLMGAFFLFLGKHLPWYIDLIGFIVFIAVGSSLFSTL